MLWFFRLYGQNEKTNKANFNTSNVMVLRKKTKLHHWKRNYFNTSNVMVLLKLISGHVRGFWNFNTSNVMVLLRDYYRESIHELISIHLMLWFFSALNALLNTLITDFNTSNVMVLRYHLLLLVCSKEISIHLMLWFFTRSYNTSY